MGIAFLRYWCSERLIQRGTMMDIITRKWSLHSWTLFLQNFQFYLSFTTLFLVVSFLDGGWKLPVAELFKMRSGGRILHPDRVASLVSCTMVLAQVHQFICQGTRRSFLQVCVTLHREFTPSRRISPALTETWGSLRHVGIEECFQVRMAKRCFCFASST